MAKDSPSNEELEQTIFDVIRNIRDPEKPETLEELDVVYEHGVKVRDLNESGVDARDVDQPPQLLASIEFTPTVPHCSLATLIGLCLRVKLERHLPQKHKLDIFIKKGTHSTENEINKQINDKERVAAALENPNLRELVEQCIEES